MVEGRIAAVKLDGDIGPAGTMVLRFLEHLTQFPVIDTKTLERWLLLAQDVPGVTLGTVLEPSKQDPGALTLIAQVSLKHVSGQASLDNRAYQLTGPIEFLGLVDLNSLTSWGDKTEVSYFHSFPNSQNFGQVSSEWFIGSRGLRLRIYAGEGINLPTGTLGALRYTGFTDIFGGQLSYPAIRTRQQNLSVYASLDALESTIHDGTPLVQISADEIRRGAARRGLYRVGPAGRQRQAGDQPTVAAVVARVGFPRWLSRHGDSAIRGPAGRTTQLYRD